MTVTLGIVKEMRSGETRVAILPDQLRRLLAEKKGEPSPFSCIVEPGAGAGSFADDDAYRASGATIAQSRSEIFSQADILVAINAPPPDDLQSMKAGAVLIGLLQPTQSPDVIRACAERSVTAIALETLPRITRAQKADVLSSMSTVSGYLLALIGADLCPGFFPMMMTAAGTVTPARVLVIGAGVAGLQAIATARRLGAVVEAYDIRAAAKEQVLSLGARFVELDLDTADSETAGGYAKEQTKEEQQRQRELLADHIASSDVVITTALIPGRPAPKLIDTATVERMKPGACVVDLAAEAGGNCELTSPGETISHNGVSIAGPLNLPARLPVHASQMFGQNVIALMQELIVEGALTVDLENDMIGPACVTHQGEVLHAPTREAMGMAPSETQEATP